MTRPAALLDAALTVQPRSIRSMIDAVIDVDVTIALWQAEEYRVRERIRQYVARSLRCRAAWTAIRREMNRRALARLAKDAAGRDAA